MGADYYERDEDSTSPIRFGVGEGTYIEGAIVDKDCRIGRNVRIAPREGMAEGSSGDVTIQDGVIVVRRNAEIPDGWVL